MEDFKQSEIIGFDGFPWRYSPIPVPLRIGLALTFPNGIFGRFNRIASQPRIRILASVRGF